MNPVLGDLGLGKTLSNYDYWFVSKVFRQFSADYVKPCNRSDTHVNECFKKRIQHVLYNCGVIYN